MSELWTEDPRAVATYDIECAGRWDHDFYLALADELGAATIVDLGCGTGVFCVDLVARGREAIGVDPAAAMLDVARARPGGDRVRWVHGTAADAPTGVADLVVMMGHVAQYFLSDEAWGEALRQCRRILHDGGRLTFETRNPDRDWPRRWTRERTTATLPHPDGGEFTSWGEIVDVVGAPTSFTETHVGHTVLPDGTTLTHAETLRFRSREEIVSSLADTGFAVEHLWGDWDRSPLTADSDEIIVLARTSPTSER
jgi:SAM-dependent methyltransferase